MKYGLIGIGSLFLIFLLAFIFQGQDFFMYQFFAPKYANVQRQVFTNTMSYNQGMSQDLDNYFVDYQRGTSDQKQAIASVVLHEVSNYDESRLPEHLQTWLQQLRSAQ